MCKIKSGQVIKNNKFNLNEHLLLNLALNNLIPFKKKVFLFLTSTYVDHISVFYQET